MHLGIEEIANGRLNFIGGASNSTVLKVPYWRPISEIIIDFRNVKKTDESFDFAASRLTEYSMATLIGESSDAAAAAQRLKRAERP